MNNPNPFVPQTTLLDQKNKTRARVKVAVLTIFACNILLVCVVLLIQGCKRENSASMDNPEATQPPATDIAINTNPIVQPLQIAATNPVAAPLSTPVITTPVIEPGHSSEYVVVKGDTLATIATKHHVTLAALKAANPTVVETKMQIGAKLQIPAATSTATTTAASLTSGAGNSADTYVVKTGDTLIKIANAHGTSVQAIQTLNNLKTTQIQAGKTLKLPARTSAAMAPVENMTMPATPTSVSNPVPPPSALR